MISVGSTTNPKSGKMANSWIARLAVLAGLTASLVSAAPVYPEEGAVYHWPLQWTPLGFVGNHTTGTPPQEITAFVDITWIGNYYVTTRCLGKDDNIEQCFPGTGQAYFNQSESATFEYLPEYPGLNWNPNHFFFDQDMTIDIAQEVVNVGGVDTETVIQAADFAFVETSAFPFQAVYGLSPVFPGDNITITSPFYQGWQQSHWRAPISAFHYCYPGTSKDTCQGYDAVQTLGGIEWERVQGKIHWYDSIIPIEVNEIDFVYKPPVFNYWALNLTAFAIGDEMQAIDQTYEGTAVFDHASYGRGAPLSVNAYINLITWTQATPVILADAWGVNNGNQTLFEIPCTTDLTTLPDLKYWFQDDPKPWIITPSNYVSQAEDRCVLNIRTLGYGDMIIGNFGETFLRDKYFIMDFGNLRVGLSDLAW